MRVVIAEAGVEYRIASDRQIRTPEDAAKTAEETRNSDTECMTVLCLDTKHGMRSADIITTGLMDASLVHPREVFRQAISKNAAAIVLVHNHPSGDPSPSAEDIRITKQLVEAGKIIDIKVIDHVILGRNGDGSMRFISMRETNMVDFG